MGAEGIRPRRPRILLYPFLFAICPVLHLYQRNIGEIAPAQALWASAAALGIAFAFWPFTRIFSARPEKRAPILFLFLLLFHSYGLYYGQIAGLLPDGLSPLAGHAVAMVIPTAAWALATCLLIRSLSPFSVGNRIFRSAVLVLLGWNLLAIVVYHGKSLARTLGEAPAGMPAPSLAAESRPDIYCFVLDEYAAPESAGRLFGVDTSPFTESLRRRNFFVAAGSTTRFALTEAAIADILNLGEMAGNADAGAMVRNSSVVGILQRRGYRIIDFASLKHLFLDAADRRIYYDLSRASIFFNDFYRVLFERSLLRMLPDTWRHRETDLLPFYRQRVLQVFEKLPAIVNERSPKFVFIHLFSPHEPFVFTAEGNAGEPGGIWDHSDPRRYLGQYKYISRRILETVDAILEESPRPPVILLQSDHGYRGSRRPDNRIPPNETVSVLNALHLPGILPENLDPSLSPRNNFRLVFNLYFGTGYPMLPSAD